jgi:hypothetical protein
LLGVSANFGFNFCYSVGDALGLERKFMAFEYLGALFGVVREHQ